MFRIIFAIVATASVVTAHADPTPAPTPTQNFTYRLKVPSVAGSTCMQNADKIADIFANTAGADVSNVVGACQGQQTIENSSLDIVVIQYTAAYEVVPYRAMFSGEQDADTQSFSETFSSYADCLSQIQSQYNTFIGQTGLTPLAAYCASSGDDFVNGYSLTVEGVGTPNNRLYSFMSTYPNGLDYTKIVPVAAKLIASANGAVAYQDSLRVFYYAPQNIEIGVDNFSFYPGTQCRDQLGAAVNIASTGGQTSLTGMCMPDAYDSNDLIVVGLGLANYQDDDGAQSADYSSYQECMQDTQRVTSAFGTSALGVLCEPNFTTEGHYQVHVFTTM